MSFTRRRFVQGLAGASASTATASAATPQLQPSPEKREKRTIYFNDARHYYLFVFEPPMTMEDAWRPVDEVAGTPVDTFIYGVERGDGLFYPSKVGMQFGADKRPFTMAAYWRTWENMQSLSPVCACRAMAGWMRSFVSRKAEAWRIPKCGIISSPSWKSWRRSTTPMASSWISRPHREACRCVCGRKM